MNIVTDRKQCTLKYKTLVKSFKTDCKKIFFPGVVTNTNYTITNCGRNKKINYSFYKFKSSVMLRELNIVYTVHITASQCDLVYALMLSKPEDKI